MAMKVLATPLSGEKRTGSEIAPAMAPTRAPTWSAAFEDANGIRAMVRKTPRIVPAAGDRKNQLTAADAMIPTSRIHGAYRSRSTFGAPIVGSLARRPGAVQRPRAKLPGGSGQTPRIVRPAGWRDKHQSRPSPPGQLQRVVRRRRLWDRPRGGAKALGAERGSVASHCFDGASHPIGTDPGAIR